MGGWPDGGRADGGRADGRRARVARVAARCARLSCTTRGPERSARSNPVEPGRVGIYACGPTVYGRIHVGNARPFVVFSLLKRFLVHEGYRRHVRGQHHRCQRQDLRRRARRRASTASELAREMTAALHRRHRSRSALGRPDHEPLASETIGEIIDADRAADRRAGMRTRRTETSTSRSARYAATASCRTSTSSRWIRARAIEGAERKRDPLDFALWKAQKPGEDTAWDVAVGSRPAGLAHRVLGDGRVAARARLRDPRWRLGPDLSPPRERGRADAAPARGRAARATLGAQRDGAPRQARRWPSRSATSSCCTTRSRPTAATR